ncbi:hypothetical protein TM7_0136 [candidate division TM7 genomosp. GTL1]|nr:hypothetical protein TM7_0136 [candidate division TM7 genomosp. GTL1]
MIILILIAFNLASPVAIVIAIKEVLSKFPMFTAAAPAARAFPAP